jgi:ribosomal protein S18
VARHVFQVRPVRICTQSNITSMLRYFHHHLRLFKRKISNFNAQIKFTNVAMLWIDYKNVDILIQFCFMMLPFSEKI